MDDVGPRPIAGTGGMGTKWAPESPILKTVDKHSKITPHALLPDVYKV